MIKLENYEVVGWEHAIRGMRNPMNSWEKSDSEFDYDPDANCNLQCGSCNLFGRYSKDGELRCNGIGPNDLKRMKSLAAAGTDHRKYLRMITVYVDITAPLYWWKEFDTYKVGTVVNSCSTMHKIHDKEFTIEDFSCGHLMRLPLDDHEYQNPPMLDVTSLRDGSEVYTPLGMVVLTIRMLNMCRERYLQAKEGSVDDVDPKEFWWQMIQLLPSSYNQKRTVMLNYEVLANIYKSRKGHKLDEWRELCKWIESLPYSELIIGKKEERDESGN